MSKFTQGPFVLSEHGKLDGRAGTYRQVIGEGGAMGGDIIAHVCVAHPYNHDLDQCGEANAHLFKAAPDLLHACEMFMRSVKHSEIRGEDGSLLETMRAAITKATEET